MATYLLDFLLQLVHLVAQVSSVILLLIFLWFRLRFWFLYRRSGLPSEEEIAIQKYEKKFVCVSENAILEGFYLKTSCYRSHV